MASVSLFFINAAGQKICRRDRSAFFRWLAQYTLSQSAHAHIAAHVGAHVGVHIAAHIAAHVGVHIAAHVGAHVGVHMIFIKIE